MWPNIYFPTIYWPEKYWPEWGLSPGVGVALDGYWPDIYWTGTYWPQKYWPDNDTGGVAAVLRAFARVPGIKIISVYIHKLTVKIRIP